MWLYANSTSLQETGHIVLLVQQVLPPICGKPIKYSELGLIGENFSWWQISRENFKLFGILVVKKGLTKITYGANSRELK